MIEYLAACLLITLIGLKWIIIIRTELSSNDDIAQH